MAHSTLTAEEILQFIPQQKPFRFVDEIISVNEEQIIGAYTFKEDESFYEGHFPGQPVTPGVILLECMCQIGVVALGIYLLSLEVEPEEIRKWLTMFTDAELECIASVYPKDKVIVTANRKVWRRKKLRSNIEMRNVDGKLLATATASGIGVRKS